MRSSPQACQRTTNAISYMIYKANICVINYVDDFGGVSDRQSSDFEYFYVINFLKELGLDISTDKCVEPSTEMVFLGKKYNTDSMIVSIPQEKITETIDLLHWFECRKRCTKRQLQQLIGKLAFISECVRSGRLFISRMLHMLRKYKCNHYKIHLTIEFRKDVQWWLRFLCEYNGISIIPELDWSKPDSVISTDACLKGLGGINFISCQFFHVQIPKFLCDSHISLLEMYAVFIALQFWVPILANKRLHILCDNQACVQILTHGSGKEQFMLNLARQIWFLCSKHNVQIKASYITSAENRFADLLSRWYVSENYSKLFLKEIEQFHVEFSELIVDESMFNDIIDI